MRRAPVPRCAPCEPAPDQRTRRALVHDERALPAERPPDPRVVLHVDQRPEELVGDAVTDQCAVAPANAIAVEHDRVLVHGRPAQQRRLAGARQPSHDQQRSWRPDERFCQRGHECSGLARSTISGSISKAVCSSALWLPLVEDSEIVVGSGGGGHARGSTDAFSSGPKTCARGPRPRTAGGPATSG